MTPWHCIKPTNALFLKDADGMRIEIASYH